MNINVSSNSEKRLTLKMTALTTVEDDPLVTTVVQTFPQ